MRKERMQIPPGLQDDDVPDLMPEELERDDLPAIFANPEDELFKCYGLRPNLPVRTKVEHLHLIYRLPVDQIASLLGITRDLVVSEIEDLKNDWRQMGKPLTSDDRELERGRLIASLDRLIQQIDDQLVGPGDNNRILTLKLNALDRRAKLLGLEYDKSQVAAEETAEADILETVGQKIDAMDPEKLEEMMRVLDGQIEHLDQSSNGDLPLVSSSSSSSEEDKPALSVLANAIPGTPPPSSLSPPGDDWGLD